MAEDLLKEALALGPQERARLAQEILASLDGAASGELSPAWEAEIERRNRKIDDGTATLIPADEVFAKLGVLAGGSR